MSGKAIRARGVVQGVGFRPTIWRLAQQNQLTGSVWNDGQGVMIHAFGRQENLNEFIRQIKLQLPPLARLDSLEVRELEGVQEKDEFLILESLQNNAMQTPVTADAAVCLRCIAEINDPQNRRYRYPFTNCTHCGPRLSIIRRMPYDRCHTSMAEFKMCPQCLQEYEDPTDRRFHAQANCCPECGPKVWLENGQTLECDDPISKAADLIRQGHVLAIKGLGGFHLACNACDSDAVQRLRDRKRRYAKPFALMAKDSAMISSYACLSAEETEALQDKAAPIVLLKAQGKKLAPSIAPDDDKLGFMLPYTPLHALLFQNLGVPIVLTSGNISDEPQCIDNQDAREKLAGIADDWLMHDRTIVNRLDDSVARSMAGKISLLRRARGYTPEAVALPQGFEKADSILAMGAELKNSFCLIKKGQAIVSQHMGDLENAAVQRDYRDAIKLYRKLYEFEPACIAADFHPGYLSTQYGQEIANAENAGFIQVQHHHAHLAACMAEHGIPFNAPPVLAAIFDGLGLGEDGALWGGEFMLGDYKTYTRLGHFEAIPLPGGNQAMREPWRNAYAQLNHYFDRQTLQQDYADMDIMALLKNKPTTLLEKMISENINSPLSSSCGRWFDAFAATLGLYAEGIHYEGQAAIALENIATPFIEEEKPYAKAWSCKAEPNRFILSWAELWRAVLNDLKYGKEKGRIAARIHQSLIAASIEILSELSFKTGANEIVLSGGVFQNKLILEGVSKGLKQNGKKVLSPERYPMNDGGLALGQAVIAAAQSALSPSQN